MYSEYMQELQNNDIAVDAIDTETVDGKAILICNSETYIEPKNFKQCVDFIFNLKADKIFAYNLDYDITAILKYLPYNLFEKLYFSKTIKYEDYEITYVKDKFFQITKGNHRKTIYDLFQFFNTSLNKASLQFLKKQKIDISKRIIENLGKYYKKYKKKIIEYCINDARLTKELAKKLIDMFHQSGIYPKHFYSMAYIAGTLIKDIPDLDLPKEMYHFIQKAYYGGRNEICYRGTLKDVYIYDIKSAYPSVIQNLPDLNSAVFEWDTKPKTDYFFVSGYLTLKKRFIYPVPYSAKINNRKIIIFPEFYNTYVVISNYEYNLLLKLNLIDKFKIDKVLNIYIQSDNKPFAFVRKFYEERKKGDAQNYIYKIILNSIYGKFYEKQINYEYFKDYYDAYVDNYYQEKYLKMAVEESIIHEYKKKCKKILTYKCNCETCKEFRLITKNIIKPRKPKNIELVYDNGFKYLKKFTSYGKHHNIVYASLITAGIRCKIYEVANELNEAFIASHTDSIFSFEPIPEKFIGNDMGDFELKTKTEKMLLIGVGIYEYDNITKFRGYASDISLSKLINCKKTKFQIKSLFRITSGIIINQNKWSFSDLNKLITIEKELDLNFDVKRNWLDKFTEGKQALKTYHKSLPLEVKNENCNI